MYDSYIFASYAATFIPLILLSVASWRTYARARRDVAALDAPKQDD